MEKKLIKESEKKRDHKIWFILLSGLSLLLVVAAILLAVLIPLINKLPKTRTAKYELLPTLLEDTSKYTYSDHLLSINDEKVSVKIDTPNSSSGIGAPLYKFLYSQTSGESSEINISFIVSETNIKKLTLEIYLSDNMGENITKLSEEQYTTTIVENIYVTNVKYGSDIYLHHVIFSYDYLA